MKKKNGQRGAFLVLAAVIIPFIFICAGFAADFGKAWAVRAKLQNAADAAVLAGAYQYSSNDQGNVEKLIRTPIYPKIVAGLLIAMIKIEIRGMVFFTGNLKMVTNPKGSY